MSGIGERGSSELLRASTHFGLRQWQLWADEEGFVTLRYTAGEVAKYLLHRLIGFPADPARGLRNPERCPERCRRIPRSDLAAVRALYRGTPLLELCSTGGNFKWFWLHSGSAEAARRVCGELFPDIYSEKGFGRLSRILF